jgi:hypothetical protein
MSDVPRICANGRRARWPRPHPTDRSARYGMPPPPRVMAAPGAQPPAGGRPIPSAPRIAGRACEGVEASVPRRLLGVLGQALKAARPTT